MISVSVSRTMALIRAWSHPRVTRSADSRYLRIRSSSAPLRWNTNWLHSARATSHREIMPARYSGGPNATMEALAMTVLSRSKKAASMG